MSRVYFIRDARGQRELSEVDLPLSVGGSRHCEVSVPGLPADCVVAFIALSKGHAYLQPAYEGEKHPELYHNHVRLSDSVWLKSGDQVQVGDVVLDWRVEGDRVFLDVRQAEWQDFAGKPVSTRESVPGSSPAQTEPPAAATLPPAGERAGDSEHAGERARSRLLRRAVVAGLALLLLAALYVTLAVPVALKISPQPDEQSLRGWPPPVRIGASYLTLPGHYVVHATLRGFRPLAQPLDVSMGPRRELHLVLQELPGRITFRLKPSVAYRLLVDGIPWQPGSDGAWELERGRHRLRVETDRYLPEEREVEIAGLGKKQTVAFTLRPAWAKVRLTSNPEGAHVLINGEPAGRTPLGTEILQGTATIVVSAEGYKPLTIHREIQAGQDLDLADIELALLDGRLAVTSSPAGAAVSVDDIFKGATPAELSLTPGTEHVIRLSKPGFESYEQRVTLATDEKSELTVPLSPSYGVIFLASEPVDAELLVDGKPAGQATRRLRLTTRPHTLELRKDGYASERLTVAPQAGIAQTFRVALKTTEEARLAATPATITTAAGQLLRLVRPGAPFHMGAARHEAGRRANESERLVQLTHLFFLGEKEVTNAEFRLFMPSHRSGTVDDADLERATLPVVNVSWDDAARYCNWLSRQDGLPLAYHDSNGHMVPVRLPTTGYRLPTEAEWAYVARVYRRRAPARYPWEGGYPPKSPVGNFADTRIADTLAEVVPHYDDGYRGTSPVGSFPPNAAGIYDLGGNVAEWINDFYAVYPGQAEHLVRDPTGPPSGNHHLVRGSSWRHGSIIELRASYRDYSRTARSDLGFRLARDATAPKQE